MATQPGRPPLPGTTPRSGAGFRHSATSRAREVQMQAGWKRIHAIGVQARTEPVRDHAVVARGVCVDFRGKASAQVQRGAVVRVQGLDQLGIIGRIDQGGDVLVVLGRGAQHRRSADVDVLDRIVHAAIRRGGSLLERIQVDDQQVDALDAVRGHHRIVLAAPAEQATVDFRMQGLDPAVHDFRKSGDVGDFTHGESRFAQRACGAAGGNEYDAERVQATRQVDEAGLVGHAQQRAPDGAKSHRTWARPQISTGLYPGSAGRASAQPSGAKTGCANRSAGTGVYFGLNEDSEHRIRARCRAQ